MSLQGTPAASVASTGSAPSSNSAAGNGASGGSAASVSVLFEKDKIWYFSNEQLANSPSRRCGIKADEELHYRQMTSFLIQEMGQRLQVSQLCINTAIVYMHRFYAFHSFTHFHRNSMASASLFLAAKVEEQPRKLEHVIRAANKCLAQTTDQNYADLAQELVFNENVLLQTLGFDVAIDHPHTHVVRTCQLVKACKDLAQTSYFLASNSLHLTSMCLQYRPTVVACFCIYLACKWSRWEIPQSTEGKHWFYYVDKSVSLELLKQLTDEFIAIYEKSPARLKSKLNSIRAIAQGSSNRTAANSKDKPKEDWKMSEMMKGYHSNINAPPELMNGNDGRELTSQQTAALLPPPPMVPQQRRGGDHGHQQRSSVSGTSANSSSSNHKLQNYAGPISADHTDHKSKQSGYNNRAPSNHQSSSSSAQRSSGNSSGLPSSSSSSIQRSSSSSQQPRPSMPMDYQKSSRNMPPVGMPPHGAHKMPTNTKQQPLLDTRSSSSAAAGLVNSKDAVKSSSSSSKIYPNVPPAYGNNAPNSLMRGSYMSSSSGASNGVPPNAAYHGHRSKSNSSTSSSSVHNMPSNYEQTMPGFGQNSSNQQALQQQPHMPSYNSHLQLDASSAVPPNSNNQTQQQQQQIKNNSLFSPEWSDIKKEPNSHYNGLLPPPTHESLGFKLNHVRDKDSPKKERLSTGGTPTKKDKHRSAALQLPMGTSSTALNNSHGLKAMLPPNKKLNAELMAAPNLPELAGTSRDGSNALKRANETSSSQYGMNKLDEDSLPRDKLRKLDNSGLPGYSFNSGSSQEHDKHAPPTLSISNGIETTPDLVRSLLKESLCTTKASLLMQEPITMVGLKPPAELLEPMPSMVIKKESTSPNSLALTTATTTAPTNIMGMPMDTFTKLDEIKEENVSSKSEKKKKKDKHKHKEKDKSKDKSDKEERKKHKKDKQKDRAKDTSGMGNTDSLKLVIKTNTTAGNANGLLSITHTTASDAPAAPLKLKISKNKMEPNNYSTAQSTSTATAAVPAAAFGLPATSMATTGNLGMTAAYGGYAATSMASSSGKKKDRERDKEKRKDKNADYAKYNGMVGVTQALPVAGMLATPTTMTPGMLNTMAPSSALPVYTKK